MSLWIEMGRRNCLPLQPFWRVCPRKHEQVVINFLREIRFSKLIIYGFFPPSPSSSLFDYCMFVFVATSVRSKNCYRQETAVRTVAQTLGGIAVFRFPCLLFEIWFWLIRARNSSLQGDSNSLGSRNRRDPCWSLPLRSLQCKKVNERSISTWWRLCSALCLTQVCSADLTVPVLHGAIIEGVATLICRLGSRLVALKEPQ